MDTVLPSYQSAIARDAWSIIAQYILSSDLYAVVLVCRGWHKLFMPFLWGNPASHFGTENDAVYAALMRFMRTLKYARLEVRMLTHTLHLSPALSEIHGGLRPEWLKEILDRLPCLQSLMVSELPFFDHSAMMALKRPSRSGQSPNTATIQVYNIHLLLAEGEPNTTSQGLVETLLHFQGLVYLDLSYTTPTRDHMVLSSLSQLERLQVLKLRGIGLRDKDAELLANAIGIRIRFLDLRNNMLTDMAVRSLLQASFLPPNNSAIESDSGRGVLSLHAKALSNPALDEQFFKALTRPLTGRSWVENLPHVGITHLHIADNQITVEGAASLLASSRLHVLDAGTFDTVESINRAQGRISSPIHEGSQDFAGAEKLVPILGSIAKENLTYLRTHHALCTANVPWEDFALPNGFLPELPGDNSHIRYQVAALDATNENYELSAEVNPISKLADTEISQPLNSTCNSATVDPRYTSLLQADCLRGQKIQELLAKRPKSQILPRHGYQESNFPYLHPSHVPHLETLVLTDVPSHVPANSPILDSLIRFITACSNESLLATLQAESDYSLPPGWARAKAEQERAKSLFALRRLVLEITPMSNLTKLMPRKSINYQNKSFKSSTGDRDSENMWSAAANDFTFFGEGECGFPENDLGMHFPVVDLVAKLASFRRAKKAEYDELIRGRTLASTSIPHLPMDRFVEGHWKGEVNIVRNAAPKGRTDVKS